MIKNLETTRLIVLLYRMMYQYVLTVCSTAVCDIVCLSYETLREALAGTQEAAYRLCSAVHSMLELYAEFTPSHDQDEISSEPLVAGEFLRFCHS